MTIKSAYYSAALAAALLLPAAAFAQTPAKTPAAASTPAKAAAPAAKGPSASERVEERIKTLHTELQITAAQQTEWDQFAQIMRENAKNMDATLTKRGADLASMSAADSMQSYAQVAQQHAQDTQKLANAFQILYSAMSDEQKKNADTVFQAADGHGGHRRHG